MSIQALSPVLLITGFSADTQPYDLFILFGVYGDCIYVIMSPDRLQAWIELSSGHQAQQAQRALHGVPLFGRLLSVQNSNLPSISSLQPTETTPELALNCMNSPLHRFRGGTNSRNERHVCNPTSSLHVSNLPNVTAVSDLVTFFQAHNCNVSLDDIIVANGRDNMRLMSVLLYSLCFCHWFFLLCVDSLL